MIKKIITKLLQFKKVAIGTAAVIIVAGTWGYKSFSSTAAAPQYVTAAVEKGMLTVSVGGSGQVSNSNKIEIKAQASGKLLSLAAVAGTEVKENQVLMQLDAKDAYKTLRDAQVNYESAQLALQKLTQGADSLSLIQAQNTLDNARNSLEKLRLSQSTDYLKAQEDKQKSQDNITKVYEDSFNSVSDAFLQLPAIMSGLDASINGDEIGLSEPSLGFTGANSYALYNVLSSDDRLAFQSLIDRAQTDYTAARLKYNPAFDDYKNVSRYSSHDQVEALLTETLDLAKSIAQASKSEINMYDAWVDIRTRRVQPIYSKVTSYQSQLSTYIGQVNSQLSSLLSQQRTLQDDKDSLVAAVRELERMDSNNPLDLSAAEQSVKQQEASLKKLQDGADPLDIQSQQISLRQRLNALSDVRETLANYIIRSPLDGVLAQIAVAPKDTISSGTVVATVITKQQVADISLNEVDVAKIKAGQKVNLTFDAIDGLSIAGSVASIDGVGTVAQGVVSYTVHITFDTQDERIKPGMSVSAKIITDVKSDVVVVPNAAVKSSNGGSYVQVMENGTVRQQIVEIGLSNDSETEILTGLNVGDLVVTQTITAAKTTAAAQPSGNLLQSLTGGRTGGGAGGNRQFGGAAAGR